ncbi:LCP family protein [Stackebrandtia nassauensis]|uniref:Cell envelope-related transcriptional attenuator n=1 Tax=Stackebrandtia nassauensis (strain DSM 44728 / CIP 108903 / NRRL B-16338 / NBRC 102104 / LLR-40K-21) TaxID=446470 RepID=D3Q5E2_STANL|nr:LCP family protein [Stackebrandtia nassauensis]ADD46002.1 cell envelope-related transcriptional attenuator [Stackebrandtia nassauensis DSM 44728]
MSSYRSGSDRPRASARVPSGPRATGGHQYSGKTYGGGGGPRVKPPTNTARMVVLTCLVVSLIFTLGGIGAWGYAKSLNSGLDRFDAFDGVSDRPEDDDGLNILVLGSDSRNPDSTKDSRADTIMIAHVPSNGEKAYMISLPRDLWVNVPAAGDWGGGKNKLNSASFFGGVPLMVQTVEGYTDVHIDHVIEIDFNGLIKVVDALGGVTMNVEEADAPDYATPGKLTSIHKYKGKEPRTWKAGKQTLDGESALDYVRQRKQFNEGDFARMRHQRELLKAMMDKATSAGIITSPGSLTDFLSSVTDAVKVDKEFDLISTGVSLSSLRSKDLVFMVSPNIPNGYDEATGQSIVESDKEKASALYKAIAADDMASWAKDHPKDVKGS